MSYQSEHYAMAPICFDLETAPIDNVRDYVPPPSLDDIRAPKNYKKPEAIEEYVETEKAARLEDYERTLAEKAALDWNTARIVALGWRLVDEPGVNVFVCHDGDTEREALRHFWATSEKRLLVGFMVRSFDLPMLIQRSRYLGVRCPEIDLGRYARNGRVEDIFDRLTFNDSRATSVMRRGLRSFCRRFGLAESTDVTTGAEVPAMIAAGDWAGVEAHCRADVELTHQLAVRVGAIGASWQKDMPMPSTGELVDKLRSVL